MASRPYINHSLDKLHELYHNHGSDLPVLEQLYAELMFRKRNQSAPSFRLEVEATIEAIKRDIVPKQIVAKQSKPKHTEASKSNSNSSTKAEQKSAIKKPALEMFNTNGSFSLVQVPVNLRKIVARTAHIHEYKLSRLKSEFYRHLDESEKAMIAKVAVKLIPSTENGAAVELPVNTSPPQAVPVKEPSSTLAKTPLLEELKVPSELAGAKAAILSFKSDITLGELDKLKSSTLKSSGCWGKLSYTLLSSLRDFCHKEIRRSSAKTVKTDGSIPPKIKTNKAPKAIVKKTTVAKTASNLTSSNDNVATVELPAQKSTALTNKELGSTVTKASLLKELDVPSDLLKAKIAVLTFQSDITIGGLNKLRSSTLKRSGYWGPLSYTLLASLREFCQKAIRRSAEHVQKADNNKPEQPTKAILSNKPTSPARSPQPQSRSGSAPKAIAATTADSYLRQLEVPKNLALTKAAIVNFKQNITLGELHKLKSTELRASGCWVKMSYSSLTELKEYCQRASKRPAISSQATSPNKPNGKGQASNPSKSNQAVTYATLLAATVVPKDIEDARSKILRIRPNITLRDLKYLKNKRLEIKPDDFNALQKFCRELIHYSPAPQATTVKAASKPSVSDGDIVSPLLKDIPVRGKLSLIKDAILKHDSGIKVNQLKSLRAHDSLNLSPKQLHELRLFCCQFISGQGVSGTIKDVQNTKATTEAAKKAIQPENNQSNLTGDSLLTELAFPEALTEILAKADPYLPLRATVNDLLAKGDYTFGPVAAKDTAKLKEFVRKALQQNNTSLSGGPTAATQEDFFSVPITSSAILDAPPGCGKTHSIVERLAAHVEALATPYDAKQILVLSFTRNAVNEIKQRLHQHAQNTGNSKLYYVRVMTFDSLAYRTLDRLGASPNGNFDGNITKLKSLLITGEASDEGVLSSLRWLYVDEYQDLVGCRADLVLELAKQALSRKGGAYLLGDPCQQIMNFQIKNKADTDNATFVRSFKALAGKNLVELGLEKSYRFKTSEQKERVSRLRSELLDHDSENIRPSKFAITKQRLGPLGSGTAILCPRNIDTHLIADRLREAGIDCHVNTGAEKHAAPRWLFDTFTGWEDDTMSVSLFREKCSKHLANDGEDELSYLSKMGVNDGKAINVRLLVDKLENSGGLPDSPSDTAVVVSTVHKAKGLQYRNVILLCDGNKPLKHGSDDLYAFYVAVTRAQHHFELLAPDSLQTLRRGRGGIYKYRDCLYLEGLNDICQPSILADETSLTDEDLSYLAKEEASYRIASDGDRVHLIARLYSGRELKLYRLPRLEKLNQKENDPLLIEGIRPSGFSTFIYTAEDYRTERLLGPTCMIALPVFTGLWKFKYV
ncbi:AAA family ATPase [Photobacterium sp. BZF1]|uniref:UvrD-helicase domain-containing protein n=1 Tax=Photobacterium sp. BZF1 TaxID=1904457 RepID=UPI001653AEC6|nr:UvrD-helicase domain-containing protein [Photobacterium sp. BZF1]MBC7005044.1 AAA family ATPase [Photobacterium sp. BZF1]